MPLQTGTVLNNRYRIVKLLGQGGFGAIYRAWDMNMECPRAVKENLDTSPEAQTQFKLEASILGQLTHQNLPKVIDHFILPDMGQYLVMEYVEGEDLQEKLDRTGEPLPEGMVIPWIEQICDALSYLHSQAPPIIHRDIKPANIKITPEGKAMLVDFGIAKIYDSKLKTTKGARAVTPGYSPHEQYGQVKTDARCDVYALGATLYTLLTNQEPVESIQRVGVDRLVQIQEINPAVSPAIAAATARAMRINVGDRHQSIAAFKDALRSDGSKKIKFPSINNLLPTMVIVVLVILGLYISFAPYLDPFVKINNQLARPISITINGIEQGQIEPYASAEFHPDEFPVTVEYSIIQPRLSDRSIGDDLSFRFKDIQKYKTIDVDSIAGIGNNRIFYPIVENNTGKSCSIVVNESYPSENRPMAKTREFHRVFFGYYKLLLNSNVVLYCDDGTSYFWGERLGQISSGPPLYEQVRAPDGVLVFTIND
jgi:serine/threonine protein kinase